MTAGTPDSDQMTGDLLKLARTSEFDVDAEALHRYFEELLEAATLLGADESTAVPTPFHPVAP